LEQTLGDALYEFPETNVTHVNVIASPTSPGVELNVQKGHHLPHKLDTDSERRRLDQDHYSPSSTTSSSSSLESKNNNELGQDSMTDYSPASALITSKKREDKRKEKTNREGLLSGVFNLTGRLGKRSHTYPDTGPWVK